MFCKNCGKNIGDNAVFCPECGKKVAVEEAKTAKKEKTHPKKRNSKRKRTRVIQAGLVLFFGAIVAILVWFCLLPGNVFKHTDYSRWRTLSDGRKLILETEKNNAQRVFYIAVSSRVDKETLKEALDVAVKNNYMKTTKLLVWLGADPNADWPALALREATTVDMAKLLVKLGADINAHHALGGTALHEAACNNNLEIVKFLVASGADVDIRGPHGMTPLHNAALYNSLDVVKFLIAAGADVNARDIDGSTPLLIASGKDYLECTRLFINAGADINVKDAHGKTAFDWAYEDDNKAMIQLLRGY